MNDQRIGSTAAVVVACRPPGISRSQNILPLIRRATISFQLRETFVRWYPGMQTEQETEIEKKAA